MTEQMIEAMFAFVRYELCKTEVPEEVIHQITPESLSTLYALSKHHDMAHLIGDALEQHQLLPQDAEISAKFQKQQMLAIYRYQRMNYELQELCKTLEAAHIPFIPLKGAIIRQYYPEPWMRTSCDIDILVKEEQLDAAEKAICERLGYTKKGEKNYHDISLYSPSGIHLELHFNIQENMENIDRLLKCVWDYASPVSENTAEHRLTSEFLMFHILAHTVYHFLSGGCGIKPFLDLYILEEHLSYDRNILMNFCSECEIKTFAEQAFQLSGIWFGQENYSALTEQMQAYVMRGGVYGNTENQVAVQQNQKGGKIRYLLSRIFMPYDYLKIQYPVLRKHKWLTPFCQVRRWLKLFFGGNFKRSVHELNVSQNITREQSKETERFLNQMGL